MTVLIKNCGLKTPQAIAQAQATGANFIGFVHYPKSPRHLSLEDGELLRSEVKSPVKLVAVLVSPDDSTLNAVVSTWKPDYLQIHGVTDLHRLQDIKARCKLPLILGWQVETQQDIRETSSYHQVADYILLDTKKAGEEGGTGQSFEWAILTREQPILPWFLAGGLNPENVQNALSLTHAKAVDVSSGLESSPGVKSLEKIAAFNRAVLHGADD